MSPADQGFVPLFDVAAGPEAKRAAIEAFHLDKLTREARQMFIDAGLQPELADRPDVQARLRESVQPVADAWFLAIVD